MYIYNVKCNKTDYRSSIKYSTYSVIPMRSSHVTHHIVKMTPKMLNAQI